MTPNPPEQQPYQMFARMMERHFYKEDKMDVTQTLEAMDETKIERLRRMERFFTDLVHQATENRFNDYSGTATRRLNHRLIEVDASELPLLYAGAIRDLAEAEQAEASVTEVVPDYGYKENTEGSPMIDMKVKG